MKKTDTDLNNAPRRRKLRAGHIVLAALAAAFLALVVSAVVSIVGNRNIAVKNYTVESEKIKNGVRLVLMSDLHREEFGKDNQRLVDLVAAQEPDLILLDGDMINGDYTEEEGEAFRYLLERLVKTAPVFFSQGNHDGLIYSEKADYVGGVYVGSEGRSEFLDTLESTGAVFLEYGYRDLEVNGDSVRIGGFYPYAWKVGADSKKTWGRRRSFLEDFCGTDSFKLMLSHRPETYVYEGNIHPWDIDLVLAGHTHNGVVAMPIFHRAIITSEGLFPKYGCGEFDLGGMKMIISAGLAGWHFIPRVFNPPEIDVIDLVPAG